MPQPPAASDVALVVNKTLPTVDSRAQTDEQTTDRRDSWGNNEAAKEQQQEEKEGEGGGEGTGCNVEYVAFCKDVDILRA